MYGSEADDYQELANSEEFHVSEKLANTKKGDKKTVLVDIDETIAFYPSERKYNLAEPNQDNIAKINKLYEEGWYVIYWTARGGSKKSKAAGRCYYDFTWKQLESWGCKFHDLSTGSKGKYMKPPNDMIIDDKAKRIEDL
tara:strand:- start:9973 stop:10392 length:420 start_codon:yes stop_codon:yes gene_type:complete